MLTHSNIVSNACQIDVIDSESILPEKDKSIAVLPFYHI